MPLVRGLSNQAIATNGSVLTETLFPERLIFHERVSWYIDVVFGL